MAFDRQEPTPDNNYQTTNAKIILDSYKYLLNHDLLAATDDDPTTAAQNLYQAPFVVVAHDTAPDPIFFYANLTAQHLFAMNWHDFVRLPSRYSAEPINQEERRDLLERVTNHGYIDDYSGVRISSDGRRFHIEQATVWNLSNKTGAPVGQAATFSIWNPLTGT